MTAKERTETGQDLMSNLETSAALIRAESIATVQEEQKLMEPRDDDVWSGSEDAIPVCARVQRLCACAIL